MMSVLFSLAAVVIMTVLGPASILNVPCPQETLPVHLIVEQPQKSTDLVLLKHGTEILQLPMEDYLLGVVLAEVPASFEEEAIKAQAVAARTFTMRQMGKSKHSDAAVCSDSTCCQAWKSEEELQKIYGSHWERTKEKVRRAIYDTKGEVLTYGGEYIDAVYFSCSGGTTEDAVAVWGQEIPYLVSVESRGEEASPKFQSSVSMPISQFRDILQQSRPGIHFKADPSKWIEDVTHSQGGGVEIIVIGGQRFRGTEIRSLFHLNSTKFEIKIDGQEVTIHVLGYGHRVGLSQYGANAMAKAGKSYQEILQHYYTGANLQQKNP